MLNEGIHVEDVSGVILFRPTVSPIVYKQQIGRALSASKTKEPVIFDVVNNIENLYSIGSVEQEMWDAALLLREHGEGEAVVVDRFRVIDELCNCRELFAELDETLSASWEMMFSFAEQYYREHGDLLVPRRYRTAEGYALGDWILTQRKVRDGRQYGKLDERRVALLDGLGMIWDRLDYGWEQNYQACAKYYVAHGDLNVPSGYVQDGLKIGTWIRRQRMLRDGRAEGVLTPEQIRRLDDIGMVWTDSFTARWEYGYEQAKQWYEKHGNLDVPTMYVNEKGFPLGIWLKRHLPNEFGKTQIKVTPEKKAKLDALGMVWEHPEDSWEMRYALAKAYYEENGDLNIPPQYKAGGMWIAKWLNEQRQIYIGNRPGKQLTGDQIARLEAIGMTWENRKQTNMERAWREQYQEAKQYYEAHGDLRVPENYRTAAGRSLRVWVTRQRSIRKKGRMPQEHADLLSAIGMEWELDDPWETGFVHAERYFRENGNLQVETSFICEDGYRLGNWLANQRSNHNKPSGYHRLTAEQAKRLEKIGMVWKPSEAQWMDGYIEYLRNPIEQIIGTLLHEMVHLYNLQEGIKDTSRSGYYHNKSFRESAEAHGLMVEKVEGSGYSKTSLSPEAEEFVKSLADVRFWLFRTDDYRGTEKAPRTMVHRYVCPLCGNIVRATKVVRVGCLDCNQEMVEKADEVEELKAALLGKS